MLEVEVNAELVELVLTPRSTLAKTEEAIRELLAVDDQNRANADRTCALEIAKKASCVGRYFCFENANEDPSCRAVDGHEVVTPRGLMRHLRQILHLYMDVSGLIGFEAAVLWPCHLGLQVTQVAYNAPAKTAIETRT